MFKSLEALIWKPRGFKSNRYMPRAPVVKPLLIKLLPHMKKKISLKERVLG